MSALDIVAVALGISLLTLSFVALGRSGWNHRAARNEDCPRQFSMAFAALATLYFQAAVIGFGLLGLALAVRP